MPAFCPLCAGDEFTETHKADDATRFAICLYPSHGQDGYIWEPTTAGGERSTSSAEASSRSVGLGAELEVWDKLLSCLDPDEGFVSYGGVEDRFIDRYPPEASLLLDRYGHRFRGPDHRSGRYSMSTYLALRLRDLEKDGLLELEWGPAPGQWAYKEVVSYWRLATPPRT